MHQRLLITVTFGLAALFAAAAPASAQLLPGQARLSRPSQGLFGGGFGKTGQGLDLNASLGAGYDDDLLNRPVASSSRSGAFSNGRANLSYRVTRGAVSAHLAVSAAGRYYPDLPDPFIATYFADGSISADLSKRTSLTTSYHAGRYLQNLTFFYQFSNPLAVGSSGITQGGVQGGILDPGTLTDTYLSFRSDVQVTHKLTEKMDVYGRYSFYVDEAGVARGQGRYGAQTAGAGVQFALSRDLGIRLGYGASASTNTTGPAGVGASYDGRTIDAGIDFNRTLSLTRQSTLSFATGMTGVNDAAQQTHYFAVGRITFGYEIGRSWTLDGNFRRAVEYDHTFGQPVVADSVNGGVSGMLSRRLEATAFVGFVKGTIGVMAGATRYNAENAGGGLRYAMTQSLAVSVRYSLYRYDFTQGTTPVPGPSGALSLRERQSVTVSLNTWVPLYSRSRRLNASR